MPKSKTPEDGEIPLQDMSEKARVRRKEIASWIEKSMATLKEAHALVLALKKQLSGIEKEMKQGGDMVALQRRQERIAKQIEEIDQELRETGLEHRVAIRSKELRQAGGSRFLGESA